LLHFFQPGCNPSPVAFGVGFFGLPESMVGVVERRVLVPRGHEWHLTDAGQALESWLLQTGQPFLPADLFATAQADLAQSGSVISGACSPVGADLVAGDAVSGARCWSALNGQSTCGVFAPESVVQAIKFCPDGKTIAFSTTGASTHTLVLAFLKQGGAAGKPVATGGPAPTFTQVMSGQVDVGWAAPPFGLDQLDRNEIRQIATGNDTLFKGQTVRLNITNTQTLQTRKDAIERYVKAYRETIDWMYSDPAALKAYAEFAGITEAKALRIRDGYFPKSAVSPDAIIGLDLVIPDAVNLKFTAAPLTKEQLAELIQIPPRK
jgi:ABC-type nitrate/sulfonate/bicarbonate transport system substrate-binding protein